MELAKGNAEIQVGIADYKVASSPQRLITLGLGSCVGVALYDPVTKIGGLLHIMLPDSSQFNNVTKPAKFADTGIPLMIEEIRRRGGSPGRLTAKLAGGAQMFSGLDEKFVLNIGQRNAAKVREILSKLGIRILAEELGGNRGRTMIFDTATGQVIIRTIGTPNKVI
ncbi:chemotaxis protein CheD [Desulforamulus hydrothermalis]|uniref:Probable chemoreceptor glutamine deamidase CheD n=1 Tax=Desulforamulus hydrothermalis Lam5 = DSM 18033 TaxID=1121428 RepID=K8E0Q2_9FIRM|nr:chemotaxis protein CheD [Desulforamulus hydrothermalis]CCO09187.1 Chemotaxis protein CheD [Desulforamulus hydrothermalis Lam5 = DSM 18033]SHH11040.1 chemotaxis protein CheD [Desulforamulus hydrothermalis Lam5 = DSM 18033]